MSYHDICTSLILIACQAHNKIITSRNSFRISKRSIYNLQDVKKDHYLYLPAILPLIHVYK